MTDAYMIRAALGRAKRDFRCESAWIAYEQHNRLVRQGWTVRIFNHARDRVTAVQLQDAAEAAIGIAVIGE